MLKVIKEADMLGIKVEESIKQWTLNFTDITANSNKFYSLEIIKTNKGVFLYSQYGRVGGTKSKEYRSCHNIYQAENEAQKIIKSKTKKGYLQIDLVKSNIGSDVGQSKIKYNFIDENDDKKLEFKNNDFNLHPAIQNIVKTWFNSIDQFVIDTLDTSKCALGQLSLVQINKGRDLLLDARKIISKDAKDILTLNQITSKYYSNIPMNFGNRKLDADKLRFDSNDKLDLAFDTLDTLEAAKDAEKVLTKQSSIEEKYKSLKTEFQCLDPQDEKYKWIDILFHKTRASNHNFLGKIKINNIFELTRPKEFERYLSTVEEMVRLKNQNRRDLPDLLKPIWHKRFKENKDYESLYDKANIIPLFHGTRTPNFPKILSSKLMMRKPGFTVAGAMYDKEGGLYFGFSSKACNYSSAAGSYWSGGHEKYGYLFLSDVALGKQEIAYKAHQYSLNEIHPCMSVWAKGGKSGVINDEFVVYTERQNWLRYIIEFETKC